MNRYDTTADHLKIGTRFRHDPGVDQAMPWGPWEVVKNRSQRLGGQRIEVECVSGRIYDFASGRKVEVAP